MSVLILFAGAVLWGLAARVAQGRFARIASIVQVVGTLSVVISRGDFPPAGWSSFAVLAVLLPGVWLGVRQTAKPTPILYAGQAALTAGAACWAGLAPGAGVAVWAGWAIPHILLATAGFGATAIAALLALRQLQGRPIGLLLGAMLITALPLTGERASTVRAYHEGEPITVHATIDNSAGAQGLVRTLPGRVHLPGERPLRELACGVLFLALAASIVCQVSSRGTRMRHALTLLAVAALTAHILLLASSLFPRQLGVDRSALEEAAHATLEPELYRSQHVASFQLPPEPYTGGSGAPGVPLPLAMAALTLAVFALRTRASERAGLLEQRVCSVALLALLGTAATGLVWASYAWGGPTVTDPKLYAVIVAGGLLGVSRLAAASDTMDSALSSWLVLASFAVLLLSMIGPEVGWTAPTLHHFGP